MLYKHLTTQMLLSQYNILPLKSQYMLSLLMFVVQNKTLFLTNTENYNLDTRQKKIYTFLKQT